jgi:hypothetical protein
MPRTKQADRFELAIVCDNGDEVMIHSATQAGVVAWLKGLQGHYCGQVTATHLHGLSATDITGEVVAAYAEARQG